MSPDAVRSGEAASYLPTVTEYAPLTFEQAARVERDEWARQMGQSPFPHIAAVVLRLVGELNREVLVERLQRVVHRHDALRARLVITPAQPGQLTARTAELPLVSEDVSRLSTASREKAATEVIAQEVGTPWDIVTEPPIRVVLVRMGALESLLAIAVDHLFCDAWSLAHILRAIRDRTADAAVIEEPVQFPDFARWERERLQGDLLERLLSRARRALRGCDPTAGYDLPFAVNAPRESLRLSSAAISVETPPDDYAALRRRCRLSRTTEYVGFLAGMQALLHRYTNCSAIPIPAMTAGRDHDGVEASVGWFATRLVFVAEVRGTMTPQEALESARQSAIAAHGASDLPYALLVRECKGTRPAYRRRGEPRYNPGVIMNFMPRALDIEAGEFGVAGARAELAPEPSTYPPRSTLAVTVTEGERSAAVSFRYDAAELTRAACQAVADDYLATVRWLAHSDSPLSDVGLTATKHSGRSPDG